VSANRVAAVLFGSKYFFLLIKKFWSIKKSCYDIWWCRICSCHMWRSNSSCQSL